MSAEHFQISDRNGDAKRIGCLPILRQAERFAPITF
jgi:hypothetical protein